jgi:hypothetical protein
MIIFLRHRAARGTDDNNHFIDPEECLRIAMARQEHAIGAF